MPYEKAGADAAGTYDAHFRKIIENDPEIQAVIRRVWGDAPRPADTPKHLEKANDAASKQITQILARKGIQLPDRTFVNPRSGQLEGHRGWSGLNGWQKAAIIAAAAATGVGGLAAAGALGGGAAGAAGGAGAASGGAGAGLGVTAGLPAGMAGVGATGVGAGGAAVGGGALTSALTNAGINAARTKLTGGSWKDALIGAGTGAVTGGAGMNWGQIAANLAKDPSTWAAVAGSLGAGMGAGRQEENAARVGQADFGQSEAQRVENALMNRGQLDLQQRQFGLTSQNNAYRNALLSSLMKNMKDVSMARPEGIPTMSFSGGARPSAFGAEGKAAAEAMNRRAMEALINGEKFAELPGIERVAAPEFRGSGVTENILGGFGAFGKAVEGQNAKNQQTSYQNRVLEALAKLSEGTGASAPNPTATPLTNPAPGPTFQPLTPRQPGNSFKQLFS